MSFQPSRRFLFLPAWAWLLAPPLLVLLAYALGKPHDAAEPSDMADVLRPLLLVTREGDSFRFISLEESQKITPVWSVSRMSLARTETLWRLGGGHFGFFKLLGDWQYKLDAHRFDKAWKVGVDPVSLSQADLAVLQPLVIAKLNQDFPAEKRGDRLTELLEHGVQTSSYDCPQNAVILLAWLSLALAAASIVAMFVKPGPLPHRDLSGDA